MAISDLHAVEIKIGDTKINVPAYSGFAEISTISPENLKLFQDFCPETNRLQAAFMTQEDVGKILLGEIPSYDSYILVQSSRATEELVLSTNKFVEFRKILHKQWDSLLQDLKTDIEDGLENASKNISKRYEIDADFQVSDIVPLSIDSETASSITVSMLAKSKAIVDGQDTVITMAGTFTTFLVKGKMLFLYVYKNYKSNEDIEWTRKAAKEYTAQITAANETVMSIENKIIPKGTVLNTTVKELLNGAFIKFNSKDHPKAYGIDITIGYPQSWKAEEGIRPHIVQKFTGETTGHIQPACMLLVVNIPQGEIVPRIDTMSDKELSELYQEMIPDNGEYLDGGKTKIDGKSCGWLKLVYNTERAGVSLSMYSLCYIMILKNNLCMIQFDVGGLSEDRHILEDSFNSYLPIFQAIGNSIVINDKWNNPIETGNTEYSVWDETFGKYWLASLLFSIILTWGIGLAPPLLIRYAILRRPLSKTVAIVIVVVFWFINISIFIALGSQSKTHAALFFVALVSYYILHRGHNSLAAACSKSQSLLSNVSEGVPLKAKGSLEQCSRCGRTIGKLEYSYNEKDCVLCMNCYKTINSENM